ncbi:TrmB family transcriptional regulator [Nitrosopumilus oxyclinae]|uniref:TrmB family transcriptional regulator n=1 Tax=Nitrosopumilus oxyclinae TaxID=1959104 RepID=A0A7D5M165_9ARCH|nr:helix-turn-helix domain-containing protein [Nitrosopumilus oxyclinae]QLH04546.1 TrmB family transcriptional regulator [Nitrosopumilus oxyclinae]
MAIIANTMQLGTFPVDKTNYEEIRDALVGFGLTPNQSKVFFYLGKIGSKTASDIAKAVNIPRSETYHLLTALQNKGIVEASFQHPIQFTALAIKKAVNLLISTETERLNKLKKSGPVLEEIWEKIPGATTTKKEDEEEKFKVLQGGNQVNSKIFDMILNAKEECRILGSEKDFMKFYHANFLDALEEREINYKLLTPITNKSKYIFEGIDKSKIKQLCSSVKENLCFLIKDDDEVLFFIKNEGNNKEMRAIWTNSETIIYSKALLFNNIWSKTDSDEVDIK